MLRTLIAILLAAGAASAIAAPNADQAEKFLVDFNGVVSKGQINIETMPARRQQLAAIEDLERRASRLFGSANDPDFGQCVGAVSMLKSSWLLQMQLAAGSGRPFDVAALASESIQTGDLRRQCTAAVDEMRAPPTRRTKL